MRFLLTGSAGFIGSNLVRYLIERTTHDVIGFDKLTYAGNLESLSDLAANARYSFVHGDITEPNSLRDTFQKHQPDAVFHLAAESHVDRSIDGPAEFIQTNVVGTFTLLQAARCYWQQLPESRRQAFRFLHVSTDEVFGSLPLPPAAQSQISDLKSQIYSPAHPSTINDQPSAAFSESTPYDPHSPYSASKAASDHLARAWFHTYGLPVLITNCSNNYGRYQFPEKLIPVVILKAIKGDPIPVYGRGENIRDWLYVGDHADALYTVLTKGTVGETYAIGGNNEQRNLDLVRLLCSILDELRPRPDHRSYQDQITFVTDRPGHDLRYAIDPTKIRRDLGWAPQENFASGFRKTIQWYLDNQPWWQNILTGAYRLERQGTAK